MNLPSTSHSVGSSATTHRISKFRPIHFRRATSASDLKIPVACRTGTEVDFTASTEARQFYESLISSPGLSADGEDASDPKNSINRRGRKHRRRRKCRKAKNTSAQLSEKQKTKLVNELLQGAQHGDMRKVKDALKQGCDINAVDNFSWTALMCASHSGQTDIVKYLLGSGALWLEHHDKKGRTAFDLARTAGHVNICEIFEEYQDNMLSDDQTPGQGQPHQQTGGREYRCEICKRDFTETSRAEHESSTIHLFNCQHKPQSTLYHIPEGNIGFKLLLKDGWDKEKGLGPEGQGLKFPVKTVLKRDRQGLGANPDDPKSRPRVTHFQPYDVAAVKKPKKDTSEKKMKASTLSKKSRQRKEVRERAWEIGFRQSFHTSE